MKGIMEKLKKMPQGAKASVAFFLAKFLTKGIAYVTTPIYTRLLSSEEYGQVSVFFTWLEILGIIAMFCLSYGVFNNGMVDYPEHRSEYSFSMLVMSNVITAIFSFALLLCYRFIQPIIGLDYQLIIVMCLIFLFQPAYNFWTARQRYELKYKTTVAWSLFMSIISPLIAIIVIRNSNLRGAYARIVGGEIPLIVLYVGFYIYITRQSGFKVDTSFWKTAFLFNITLIPHYLSSYLLSSSDKIMISRLVGNSATAYYSVAYSIASIALILWSSINSSLIPYTYEKCKKGDYQSISNMTIPLLMVFAGGCFLVILLAPEAISIIAPNTYIDAIYVIPPITGGVFFQVQYYIYANIVYYHKQPKYVMFASVTSTALNIILNYYFIKRYGFTAAGYTTLFCYFVQATIDFFAMRKVVGQNVYNMKYIALLSLIVIIVSVVSPILYGLNQMIRITLMLLSIAVLLINKNKMIRLVKTIKP